MSELRLSGLEKPKSIMRIHRCVLSKQLKGEDSERAQLQKYKNITNG
jgi:hypothetical protein